MFSLLVAIIYLSFISLGLPDSLLGSGWPVMRTDLNVPQSFAGIISMIISAGTIISSLSSDRLTKKFGTGLVTAVSVAITAVALLGFSFAGEYWILCLLAIPYGLGAGAVDASLNNYVALHYSSRTMNWLHCMWGVGAAISPNIMSVCLTKNLGWSMGYRVVSFIQIALTLVLFATLKLWKKPATVTEDGIEVKPLGLRDALKIKGVPMVCLSFLGYCGMESTAILWASSYLADHRGVDPITAAKFGSFYLIGITVGRFLSGFISDKLGDKKMIRIGSISVLAGISLVLIPFESGIPALVGLIVMGVGSAPVYPAIIHSTPANFGAENSQAIVGIQMASAYTGSTLVPPLFGVIASVSMGSFPIFLLIFALLMFSMSEMLTKTVK